MAKFDPANLHVYKVDMLQYYQPIQESYFNKFDLARAITEYKPLTDGGEWEPFGTVATDDEATFRIYTFNRKKLQIWDKLRKFI